MRSPTIFGPSMANISPQAKMLTQIGLLRGQLLKEYHWSLRTATLIQLFSQSCTQGDGISSHFQWTAPHQHTSGKTAARLSPYCQSQMQRKLVNQAANSAAEQSSHCHHSYIVPHCIQYFCFIAIALVKAWQTNCPPFNLQMDNDNSGSTL